MWDQRLPERSTREALRLFANQKRCAGAKVFCFQIGANDGRSNDPVHAYFTRYDWHGLLVEPQVDVFERELTKTYQGNMRVMLANVAIGDQQGYMPFYRLAVSDARWATGLSGFRRSSIDHHIADGLIRRRLAEEGKPFPSNPDDLVKVVQVATTTIPALLGEHGISNFDVLCIDTEGFDYEILKLVDFARYRPEFVLFERRHISDTDFGSVRQLLSGYDLYLDGRDAFAVLRGTAVAGSVDRMERPVNRLARAARQRAGRVKRWLRRRGVAV